MPRGKGGKIPGAKMVLVFVVTLHNNRRAPGLQEDL
jgi:hypothetical protein